MKSGTIIGKTNLEDVNVKLTWSSMQIDSNSNLVEAALYYTVPFLHENIDITSNFGIVIDGKKFEETKSIKIGYDWVLAYSVETTIAHRTNEKKSIQISATDSIHGTYVSGEISLETAIDKSVITLLPNRNLGEACSVTWYPENKKYKLRFSLGNWSYETDDIPNIPIGRPYTYTDYILPYEVAEQFDSTCNTGKMTVTLFSGADFHTKNSKDLTVTVPDNEETKPTVLFSAISPRSSLNEPFKTKYIQGYSKVKVDLTTAAKYGASIVDTKISVSGKDYGPPYESDVLYESGTISVKATATDSRGHTGTVTGEIDVIAYSSPSILALEGQDGIVVERCNEKGQINDDGTYLLVRAKVVFSEIEGNSAKLKFYYREEDGSYITIDNILNGEETPTTPLSGVTVDETTNYHVKLVAVDGISESIPFTIAVPSTSVYMDRPAGGKGMGLGGAWKSDVNTLDVYWKIRAIGGASFFDNDNEKETPFPLTPRGEVTSGFDKLACGVYFVSGNITESISNCILIQLTADIEETKKTQIALPFGSIPMYRVYNGSWGGWRSF